MTLAQKQQINLAIGRIFRLAARAGRAGDAAEYERCRSIILNTLDPEMAFHHAVMAQQHDYGRDRMKGAQGQ